MLTKHNEDAFEAEDNNFFSDGENNLTGAHSNGRKKTSNPNVNVQAYYKRKH